MEKHKCKLCFKSFANGRALGGHMRSHMMNLPIQPKPEQQQQQQEPPSQLRDEAEDEAESASSSSSEDVDVDEEGEDDKALSYLLRENPKKSFRLVDPEFSFAIDAASVVVQDRESETESSKNPTRRRSKRTRKLTEHHCRQVQEATTKIKVKSAKAESWAEPEPVSSISDATTEEDVAFCLMMLSRDKWKKEKEDEVEDSQGEEEEEENKSIEDSFESEEINLCNKSSRIRGKYKCETCKKTFRSYQALGGHRASHKKMRVSIPIIETQFQQENGNIANSLPARKIHECPVCYRVFSSGQALGGHKRSHVTGSATIPAKNSAKIGDNLIDLNLPAPMDDDDISQIELSAVSDAEFVNHIKR